MKTLSCRKRLSGALPPPPCHWLHFFPLLVWPKFTPSPSLFYENTGPCTATARRGLWNLLHEISPLPSFSSFLNQTEQRSGESCPDMPKIRLSKQARTNWNVQLFPSLPVPTKSTAGRAGTRDPRDAGKGSPSKPAAQAGPPLGQGAAQPAQHQPHPC